MTTFGIDLGTTCSAIGWVRDGRPELLDTDSGVLMPSVVLYPKNGEPVVGDQAENQSLLYPDRLFRSTKRDMGSNRRWLVGDLEIGPVEVAAEILRALCTAAEKATGERPHEVVISVPAWFQQDARADTKRAAEIAGLQVVRLLNEPTAAALAHANGSPQERVAMVFDFGGGTFDASLVDQQSELVEVLASRGDVALGGDDLDKALVAEVLDQVRQDQPELAAVASADPGAREKLRSAVRAAKHALSQELTTVIRVPFIAELDDKQQHLEVPLDRGDLEECLAPLIQRAVACVSDVLADAKKQASEVDALLLVGGSSQIPLVWQTLREAFGWEGSSAIPPQRAVALGAALQGALIDGIEIGSQLLDVAPHPIGVASMVLGEAEGRESLQTIVILPRNSPLPGRHTHRFYTSHRFQKTVEVPVLQGSDPNPLRTVILGSVEMTDLPPAPTEDQRPLAIEVRHDLSGMVSVRMIDELSGRSVNTQVVAGGEGARTERERMRHRWMEEGLELGDGTDPDPYLENETSQTGAAKPRLLVGTAADQDAQDTAPGADLQDARMAFELVRRQAAQIAKAHPEHAQQLQALADEGLAAVESGDAAKGCSLYDDMTDIQFMIGLYL